MSLVEWIKAHDRGFASLRRAGRTAIVMPGIFALGDKGIGNPVIATFAAFGSFALLLLVDYTGPMRDRLQAQASLGLVGGTLHIPRRRRRGGAGSGSSRATRGHDRSFSARKG